MVFLVAHWIGDFLFQTTKMATQKNNSLKWLSLHVSAYTAVIFIFATLSFSWQVALGFTVINGFLHFIVDFFTSKLTSKYRERSRIFNIILGFDQLIHMACLYWTFLNSDILAL